MRVRYVGFLAEDSGYGVAARAHCDALERVGVDVERVPVRFAPDGHAIGIATTQRDDTDVTIAHVPGPALGALDEAWLGGKVVLHTVWETCELPDGWAEPLGQVDAVWTPSTLSARALAQAGRAVEVIPHPVALRPQRHRAPGAPFTTLSVFNWQDRKGPHDLLRALRDAFGERENVRHLLRIGGPWISPEVVVRVARMYLGDRALVRPFQVSREEVENLYRDADCYVSLHRAEGFGLSILDAAAHGVPIVATSWGGFVDVLPPNAFFGIDWLPVPAEEQLVRVGAFTPSMTWAKPDHEHAVDQLRDCYQDHERREAVTRRARALVGRELNPKRIGRRMLASLETLLGQR